MRHFIVTPPSHPRGYEGESTSARVFLIQHQELGQGILKDDDPALPVDERNLQGATADARVAPYVLTHGSWLSRSLVAMATCLVPTCSLLPQLRHPPRPVSHSRLPSRQESSYGIVRQRWRSVASILSGSDQLRATLRDAIIPINRRVGRVE